MNKAEIRLKEIGKMLSGKWGSEKSWLLAEKQGILLGLKEGRQFALEKYNLGYEEGIFEGRKEVFDRIEKMNVKLEDFDFSRKEKIYKWSKKDFEKLKKEMVK